tara:strand:- start:323 stop:907 length:585 start_codon:yes stop_codon:yes gene_type:complete
VRNGWLVLALSLLTVGVYTIAWLYRLQQEHPRRPGIDPPAAPWLALFVVFTAGMFATFAVSGYGTWDSWDAATSVQRGWFSAGLAVAVLFNAWFGFGAYRLTERFRTLADAESLFRRAQPALLTIGVVLEAVAVIAPVTMEVGLVEVPETVEYVIVIAGHIGTGSLLTWAIVLHRDANVLAERRLASAAASAES